MDFIVELTKRERFLVTVPDNAISPADVAEAMARDGEGFLISTDREWTDCQQVKGT